MSYGTGNIAGGFATQSPLLVDAIEAVLALHANWEKIENYTPADGHTRRIWKCKAAGNAAGIDFYVAFAPIVTTPGHVIVQAFEAWNTTTKLATRPVVAKREIAPDTDKSVGATTYALDHADVARWNLGLSATLACDYFVQVSKDRVCIGFKTSSSIYSSAYIGLIESLVPGGADPMPLVVLTYFQTGSTNYGVSFATATGGSSRHPKKVGPSVDNWHMKTQSPNLGFGHVSGDETAQDLFHDAAILIPAMCISAGGSQGAPGVYGWFRGVLRGAVHNSSIAGDVGATILIGGNVYVGMVLGGSNSSGVTWINTVEA